MFNPKKLKLTFLLLSLALSSIVLLNVQAQVPPQQSGTGVSITIEGAAPPAPPIPPVGLGPSGGFPTPLVTVVLEGFTYPNSLVTFVKNGVVVGNTVSDQQGYFEKEISTTPDIVTFGAWARDGFGLNSQTTNVIISINTATKTTISNIMASPTITADRSSLTQGEKMRVYGSSVPGSLVRIVNNYALNQTLPPIKVDSEGHWEYNISTLDLQPGDYSIKAISQLQDKGLISPFSQDLIFNVQEKQCYGSDLSNDGKVDVADFSILMFYWNKSLVTMENKPVNGCADVNGDGFIGLVDFSIMMYKWNA